MRSKEEATKLAGVLREEADDLPERNLFGDSNEEVIADNRRMARMLEYYGQTGDTEKLADHADVHAWLNGRESMLDDYNIVQKG